VRQVLEAYLTIPLQQPFSTSCSAASFLADASAKHALAMIFAEEFYSASETGAAAVVTITAATHMSRRRRQLRSLRAGMVLATATTTAATTADTTATPATTATAAAAIATSADTAEVVRLLSTGLLIHYTVTLRIMNTSPQSIQAILGFIRYIVNSNAFVTTLTTQFAADAPQLATFTASNAAVGPTMNVSI